MCGSSASKTRDGATDFLFLLLLKRGRDLLAASVSMGGILIREISFCRRFGQPVRRELPIRLGPILFPRPRFFQRSLWQEPRCTRRLPHCKRCCLARHCEAGRAFLGAMLHSTRRDVAILPRSRRGVHPDWKPQSFSKSFRDRNGLPARTVPVLSWPVVHPSYV